MRKADVVILSWNRVPSTLETIQNILEQKNVDVSIYLVDQGSEESQLNFLKKEIAGKQNITMIEVGTNIGVPSGRNLGMKLGKSEYIFCIDNDAIYKSDTAMERTIKKFDEDKYVGCISLMIKNFYSNGLDVSSWAYPRQLLNRSNEEFLTTRFNGGGHAMRRSILNKTNLYDESLYFYWEELDLSYQMINLGYKILYYPAVVILHKVSMEDKVNWKEKRFYYLVRNAIYLDWKYYRIIYRVFFLIGGYFIKGIYNNLISQTMLAIKDGLIMAVRLDKTIPRLSMKAKHYITKNELVYRGNLIDRLKNEVFEKININ